MGAIAGIIGPNASYDIVRKMIDSMPHRGDGTSITNIGANDAVLGWRGPGVEVPFLTGDGDNWMVIDGQIYNFPRDREYILRLYSRYGEKMFPSLNGSFAIAVWNGKKLTLARDRFGTKPLFYSRMGRNIIFASEMKAILASTLIPNPTYNMEAIDEMLTLGYPLGSYTLLNEINSVEIGTIRSFPHVAPGVWRYWTPPPIIDAAPLGSTVLRMLGESVAMQTLPNEPIGAYLSGGLDTSTIVALASKVELNPLKTFCMGFGQEDDEFADAQIVAKKFNTDHSELLITPEDILKCYPRMVWHCEFPKVNTYGWFISEMASKHVKICLSGEGGDELFCGYPQTSRFKKAFTWPEVVGAESYLKMVAGESYSLSTVDRLAPYFKGVDFIQDMMRCELQTKLPYDYIQVDEAMSSAHGVDNRTPMLDNTLVDTILKVPWKYQMNEVTGKLLLRAAMRDVLPPEIFAKPKHGFSLNVPNLWENGLKDLVRQRVIGNKLIQGLCPEKYDAMIKNVDDVRSRWQIAGWMMLGLDLFDKTIVRGGKPEW